MNKNIEKIGKKAWKELTAKKKKKDKRKKQQKKDDWEDYNVK